jgi:hypothetical protein
MDYNEFLNRVINEGIEAAKADYKEERQKPHLEGLIAGFEACRNKNPLELIEVFKEANEYVKLNYDVPTKYWWFRCYQLEVEWVCNVVSAVLVNEGKPPIFSWLPTCNGMLKAAKIIGVAV